MQTKENQGVSSLSEIFINPIPTNRYGLIFETEPNVIMNPCDLEINKIKVEASSLVDEKVITILPAVQIFMQSYFNFCDLIESDIVNGCLILTYIIKKINYYDSLSDLISNELYPIHEPLTRMIEDNLLINVKLTVQIETN